MFGKYKTHLFKNPFRPCVVVPSVEAESGRLKIQGQLGLHSEFQAGSGQHSKTLSQKKKKNPFVTRNVKRM
jgi:hypothetical protein